VAGRPDGEARIVALPRRFAVFQQQKRHDVVAVTSGVSVRGRHRRPVEADRPAALPLKDWPSG